MTTTVKISCNGNYVATVKTTQNGKIMSTDTVGPGNNVEKTFWFYHGSAPTVYGVSEREATPAEVEAAKGAPK